MKYVEHNPDRPVPMERWIFVVLIFEAGLCFGAAVIAGFIQGQVFWAVILALLGAIAGCYVQWRVKEAGWP